MPGPYFEGQIPATCGHYYPDVLRMRDEQRADGTLVRIIDCTECGRYEHELDPAALDPALVRQLNKQGIVVAITDDDLAAARARALKRLSTE